ncbi:MULTISPECIES: hypothetical protein [Halomonadaceae]|uniref:Uncharacterized protein n=2 Tax=Vreelandella TaxID=3137766 RepID=A0A7Z0LXG4_9GAMM|nr:MULTISPECIES: hypothetical protein [Halomonas]AJY52436.1 hypothetical protein KO116_03973 [Halomonas sp. KO116]EHA17264.1 hypothetical protein HAL1_02218 [Halomonas sp. HAL1]NYS80408.1 hypothetical protein [Halomonas glaciei]WKV93369.1 hypothetical protein Q3Y66_01675 [Halomonas sp. HAL1]|tara:strand:+ start:277 stop:465 length:189 start_codon:yes stop_codon:yes gene_type:complete
MMTQVAKKLAIALFMALMAGGLIACDDQGPAEEAGENIDDAAEDAGESMEELGEDMEESAEN